MKRKCTHPKRLSCLNSVLRCYEQFTMGGRAQVAASKMRVVGKGLLSYNPLYRFFSQPFVAMRGAKRTASNDEMTSSKEFKFESVELCFATKL